MASEVWDMIHAERAALLDDVAGLTPAQWQTRSLCSQWTVHQVLGHVTATAKMTPPKFFGAFIRSGFDFDRYVGKYAAAESAGTPAATLAELRAHLDDTTSPPGPTDAMVGEIVVHGMDIRQPLGMTRQFPPATLVKVAEFFAGSNLIVGAKSRIAGVRLAATDQDWSRGSGPEVSGPMLSLVLAMTGRAIALDDLTGDGVALLRERMPTAK